MNLKELSEYLRLSPTTVSRALNGFPEVNEKTRARVQQAAIEFDYKPSMSAKSLATGRSMTIGHVVPQSREELLNPIFGDFIGGAGIIYAKFGYRMLINLVPDEEEEKTYRELVNQRSVDGVILHGPHIIEPRIELLKQLGLPFLIHGRAGGMDYDYSFVDVNNRRAFRRATAYLIELGHRRIALLNGYENANFAYRRKLGYIDALNEAGLEYDEDLVLSDQMTMNFGHISFNKLNKSANAPTAYVCSSSVIAMGLHHALNEAGLKIARDISVVTHDDDISFFHHGANDNPVFTSMRSSVKLAGMRCAEFLINLIENPDGTHRQELWESELIIGQSTGFCSV